MHAPDDLPQELDFRRQGILVVQDAEKDDPRAAQQDADDVLRQRDTQNHGQDGGQINGQAAEARHDVRMYFSFIRSVHRPDAERQLLHVGREQEACQQGDDKG